MAYYSSLPDGTKYEVAMLPITKSQAREIGNTVLYRMQIEGINHEDAISEELSKYGENYSLNESNIMSVLKHVKKIGRVV